MRQFGALNCSGMLFTAATLAIADALGRFRAVLRAGGVVVINVILKIVLQCSIQSCSGMGEVTAILPITNALGCFCAVLRAGSIIIIGITI